MSQFEFHCWKLKEFTWNKAGHILNLIDKIFDFVEFQVFFTENEEGKNELFIGKNKILNPLAILYIAHNIWLLERPCWEKLYLKVKVYITNLLSVCNLQKILCLKWGNFVRILYFWGFLWPWKLTFTEHWVNSNSLILFPWWLT